MTARPEMIAEQIGPYRLQGLLADEPGCSVHEARHVDDAQRVALRVFAAMLPSSAIARLAALAESAQPHPNIIAVRGVGEEGSRSFVATDHVEGESLVSYLARVGRLPTWQGLALVAQLLSALDFAHRRGWVHGALAPRRLVVNRSGQLMIDGFGWAAPLDMRSPQALEASPYAAPEQLLGAPADHRSDLYSATVVAYELLTGAPPFQVIDGFSSGRQVVRNAPLPARTTRPELPAKLEAVFQRALAFRPEVRYRTAGELLAATQAALGSPVWDRPQPPLAPIEAAPAAAAPQVQAEPKGRPRAVQAGADRESHGPREAVATAVRPEATAPSWRPSAATPSRTETVMPQAVKAKTDPAVPATAGTAAAAAAAAAAAFYAAPPRSTAAANSALAEELEQPPRSRAHWIEIALAAGCLATMGWIASMFVGAASPTVPAATEASVPAVGPVQSGSASTPMLMAPSAEPSSPVAPVMNMAPPPTAIAPPAAPKAAPPEHLQPLRPLPPRTQAADVHALEPPSASPSPRAIASGSPRPESADEAIATRALPTAPAAPAASVPTEMARPGAPAPSTAANQPTPATMGAPSPPPRPVVQSAQRRNPEPTDPRRSAVRVVRALSPNSPEQTCRQDLAVAREFCVVMRCATAEFRHHPVCVRMHAEQQRVRDLRAESMP